MTNIEIWKDIPNYEGLYYVSNLGRVKSSRRVIYRKGTTIIHYIKKEKIIGKLIGNHGYYVVTLFDGKGNNSLRTVHTIVASVWIDNQNNKPCVNHIDGNKLNNNVSNLEWVTYSENLIHAQSIGLQKRYSLIATDIINNKVKYYISVRDAINDGFYQQCISDCCKGKSKSHKGFKWKYTGESSFGSGIDKK